MTYVVVSVGGTNGCSDSDGRCDDDGTDDNDGGWVLAGRWCGILHNFI